ncbi:MAG: hypothetical protein ABIQ31_03275 [Ferruginibacter sp.]
MEQAIDEISDHNLLVPPVGMLKDFFDSGTSENTVKCHQHETVLSHLLKEHESIIVSLQKNINVRDERSGDTGTTSFLTQLREEHETIVGILRRYMNKALPNPVY